MVLWYGFFFYFAFSSISGTYLRCVVQTKGIHGYYNIDQLGRMKLRMFRLILEICWYLHQLS